MDADDRLLQLGQPPLERAFDDEPKEPRQPLVPREAGARKNPPQLVADRLFRLIGVHARAR